VLEDFKAALDYLKIHTNCNGKTRVIGFYFGGWISNIMTVELGGLLAAATFNGGQPNTEQTGRVQASLFILCAALYTRG
jgi:carboxymethylenebutenolidase